MRQRGSIIAAFVLGPWLLSCGGSSDATSIPATGGSGGADAMPPDSSIGGSGGSAGDASSEDASGLADQDGAIAVDGDGGCGTGTKWCGTSCIDVANPNFGCGVVGCDPCVTNHGTPACIQGACGIGKCDSGWDDCNQNPADGCEKDVSADMQNCGACGAACSGPNAQTACQSAQCVVTQCSTGFFDCDLKGTTGCESDVATDPSNCGSCGHPCALPHALQSCLAGSCTVAGCDTGWGNCDGDLSNGCEADVSGDPAHCGSCSNSCSNTLAHSTTSCAAGQCVFTGCLPGYGNCDGVAGNGCEAGFLTDAGNCGGCGASCSSSQYCANGQCKTIPVAEMLVVGPPHPFDLAVNGTHAYWVTEGGQVMRISKSGGVASEVASQPSGGFGIVLDATSFYWTTHTLVCKAPLAGGSCTGLVSGTTIARIATDGTDVFWSETSSVSKVSVFGGGAPLVLASGESGAGGVAVDGTDVFWTTATNPGSIKRAPKSGGVKVALTGSEERPYRLALDATHVYFAAYAGGTLRRVPKLGGVVETLASGATAPLAVTVGDDSVYWTDESSVRRTPCAGGPTTTMATGQLQPNAIAVDASYVYWTNFGDGAVWRMLR